MFTVRSYDPRFRLFDIGFQGIVRGRIETFARLPPQEQPSLNEVAAQVSPEEFRGTRSLVIGGSRGLGELTAKILASGGGHVVITYASGFDEARRIRDEINDGGRSTAEILKLDLTVDSFDSMKIDYDDVDAVYYFATPRIFRQQASVFEPSVFHEFSDFYIKKFYELCVHLEARAAATRIKVFFPSTVAVSERPKGMTEYSMAKAAAEVLTEEINRTFKRVSVLSTRLPRLSTRSDVNAAAGSGRLEPGNTASHRQVVEQGRVSPHSEHGVELPEALVNTRRLVEGQLAVWPEHRDFLARSFAERDAPALTIGEETAAQVMALVETRLDEYCRGYRWMCEAILKEELFFRRHGRYQATSFDDVSKAVYDEPEIMAGYMRGLLLSQVFWRNHVDVARFYRQYLASLPQHYDHLEVGPGHGLLLAHAAMDPKCQSVSAWDVSDASLESTRQCLERMKVSNPVTLQKRNIYELDGSTGPYQSVVVNEVLEHLEDPAGALVGVRHILGDGGRAFINVPCNSPAPDHLYLFSKPDDFFGMLEGAGFTIVDRLVTPATGVTLNAPCARS